MGRKDINPFSAELTMKRKRVWNSFHCSETLERLLSRPEGPTNNTEIAGPRGSSWEGAKINPMSRGEGLRLSRQKPN